MNENFKDNNQTNPGRDGDSFVDDTLNRIKQDNSSEQGQMENVENRQAGSSQGEQSQAQYAQAAQSQAEYQSLYEVRQEVPSNQGHYQEIYTGQSVYQEGMPNQGAYSQGSYQQSSYQLGTYPQGAAYSQGTAQPQGAYNQSVNQGKYQQEQQYQQYQQGVSNQASYQQSQTNQAEYQQTPYQQGAYNQGQYQQEPQNQTQYQQFNPGQNQYYSQNALPPNPPKNTEASTLTYVSFALLIGGMVLPFLRIRIFGGLGTFATIAGIICCIIARKSGDRSTISKINVVLSIIAAVFIGLFLALIIVGCVACSTIGVLAPEVHSNLSEILPYTGIVLRLISLAIFVINSFL